MSILLSSLAIRILNFLVSTISISIISRYFGPNKYAIIALIEIIMASMLTFSDLGITRSTSYYIKKNENEDIYKAYFIKGFMLKLIILIFTTLIALIFKKNIMEYLKIEESSLFFILIIYMFVQVCFMYCNKVSETLGHIKLIGLKMPQYQMFFTILSMIFAILSQSIIAYFLIKLVMFAYMLLMNLKYLLKILKIKLSEIDIKKITYKEILHYGLGIYLSSLSLIIYRQSDTLMIKHFIGLTEIAYYSIIIKITTITLIIGQTLNTTKVSRFSSLYHNRDYKILSKEIKDNLLFISFIYAIISINIFIFAKDIVLLMFGEKYIKSIIILQIYSINIFFTGIQPVITDFLDFTGDGKKRSKLVGISAVINVLLNLYLIPKYGIVGAAISTQLTYTPYAIICFMELKRKSDISININKKFIITAVVYITFLYLIKHFSIQSIYLNLVLSFVLVLMYIFSLKKLKIYNFINMLKEL